MEMDINKEKFIERLCEILERWHIKKGDLF